MYDALIKHRLHAADAQHISDVLILYILQHCMLQYVQNRSEHISVYT